jgi:hypothetical protein
MTPLFFTPLSMTANIILIICLPLSSYYCIHAQSTTTAATTSPRPFGYQSDSTHSVEYRARRFGDTNDDAGHVLLDPSSYVGHVIYDIYHHALYIVGSTYGSGPGVFDGVDVYEQSVEKGELLSNNVEEGNNDSYWWIDMATGLRPHLGDVGIPNYSPYNGDCYYAILALPISGPEEVDASGGGVDSNPGGEDSGGVDDVHRVKLLHARRFGSANGAEGCSTMDMLLPTRSEDTGDVGGYMHDIDQLIDMPPDAPTGPTSITTPPPAVVDVFEEAPSTPTAEIPTTTSSSSSPPPVADILNTSGTGGRRRTLQEYVQTRSVRLLMAGHVETITGMESEGYVISDLTSGTYNQAQVYAFAQQIDVRLPSGDLDTTTVNNDATDMENGVYTDLDYILHDHGKEEDELAQELEVNFKTDVPRDDFLKIITSGIESRALLNDDLDTNYKTVYPVALVADATTKRHYYVALLASTDTTRNENNPQGIDGTEEVLNRDFCIGEGASQRGWTDDIDETDFDPELTSEDVFGPRNRPNYGNTYQIILKKMSIDGVVDTSILSSTELTLADKTIDENLLIAMRHGWVQEFRPDQLDDVRPTGLLFAPSGDFSGDGDLLVMIGTTAGRGVAFGTEEEQGIFDTASDDKDLDGFVAKIRADTGAFGGGLDFDSTTNALQNTESLRIKSNIGQTDTVVGICATPLRPLGELQAKTEFIYVVGSTTAVVQGVASDVRSDTFLSQYPINDDADSTMEAYLMKIDLSTMNTVWTVQVGAVSPIEADEWFKGSVFGYGCAVTRDGEDVYLTGLVKEGGVITDFSGEDYDAFINAPGGRTPGGGTDVFVSSYKTADGSVNFMRQVGSTKDDFPSRGNGGITTDRFGNAVITGNTRGSLMRSRGKGEYIYGPDGEDAAMEVFVMSFDRLTSNHVPVASDSTKPMILEPLLNYTESVTDPSVTEPASEVTADGEESVTFEESSQPKKQNGALVGIIAAASVFAVLTIAAAALVMRRIKKGKEETHEEEISNNTNLHAHRVSVTNLPPRRSFMSFNGKNGKNNLDPDMSGRSPYRTAEFGTPNSDDGIVEQSLFMEDEVMEIENNYVIGDLDDVSDEDLLKAYNDAMAVEIEPENPDVEIAMSGLGVVSEPKTPRGVSPSDASLPSVT